MNTPATFPTTDPGFVSGTPWPGYTVIPPPKLYLCPSDSSGVRGGMAIGHHATGGGGTDTPITNYVVNGQVFTSGTPKIPSSMPDGTSTTAMMYERYGVNKATPFGETNINFSSPMVWMGDDDKNPWNWNGDSTAGGSGSCREPSCGGMHYPVAYGDSAAACWTCVTPGQPFSAANPFNTFQAQPTVNAASGRRTQSMHSTGMNVLMGDASVKIVGPAVSLTSWSAAVTPNSSPKDIVGPDF